MTGLSKVIKNPQALNATYSWESGFVALKSALNLETLVTRKIRDIIEVCQNGPENYQGKYFDDYHLVDYLTGDFLTEQYEGMFFVQQVQGRRQGGYCPTP